MINSLIHLLPANSSQELMEINNQVIECDAKKLELIQMCSLLGGDTIRKIVFLIMSKMFSKNLACEYAGQGKKKKTAFCDIKALYYVVMGISKVCVWVLEVAATSAGMMAALGTRSVVGDDGSGDTGYLDSETLEMTSSKRRRGP
ncbi:hypothetical protein Zmor_026546 [Zophobas morio]|uniref:DUF4806 domain-containing protein n=1 Tax=Zophobas morio TaxID=2755281 RepID=A0AA38HUJ8_9CUCU|nr:hypothetical protein Zmor_026546 [Zophobas morio]